MNPWWLAFIVPASASFGAIMMALFTTAKREDDEILRAMCEDDDVVYCRDCIHSDTFAPDCTEATFPLKCLFIRYGGVKPDWFCEHGERK